MGSFLILSKVSQTPEGGFAALKGSGVHDVYHVMRGWPPSVNLEMTCFPFILILISVNLEIACFPVVDLSKTFWRTPVEQATLQLGAFPWAVLEVSDELEGFLNIWSIVKLISQYIFGPYLSNQSGRWMWRRRCTMSLDLSQRGQPKRELGERLAKAWGVLVLSYLCIWICLHQLFVVHREREINSASIVSFREEFSPLFGRDLWRKVWGASVIICFWSNSTSSLNARIQMSTSSCLPEKTFIMW